MRTVGRQSSSALRAAWGVLLAVAIGCLASPAAALQEDGAVIIAGVPANFPLEYFVDEDGKPYGFAIEVMDEVAARSGFQVRYVVYETFADAIAALRNGQVNVIPILGITEERKAYADFTAPLETFEIRIFTRSTVSDISSLDDLAGRPVAVVAENQGAVLVQQHGGLNAVTYRSPEEALMALISGNADALVYPDAPLWQIARQSGLETRIQATGAPLAEIKRALAVGKGQPELYAALDAAVDTFLQTPEYQAIYTQWFGEPQPFWTVGRVLSLAAITLAVALAVSFIFHYGSTLKLNRKLAAVLDESTRSTHALRESEERHRIVAELMSDYVYAARLWPDGRSQVEWDSGSLERICGYAQAEIDQMSGGLFALVLDEDQAQRTAIVPRLLAGESQVVEYRIRARSGEIRWLRDYIQPVEEPDGAPPSTIVGALRNITPRKTAEQALRISLEKYRILFESFPLGITVTDAQGNILEANAASEQLLGVSPDEHIRRTVGGAEWRIIRPDGTTMPPEEYASVRALNEQQIVRDVEMGVVKGDGQITWINVTAAPIPLEDYGVAVTYHDITRNKHALDLLRDSQARFRQIVERSSDVFYRQDIASQRFEYISPKVVELLGYTPEEVLAMDFAQQKSCFHPQDLPGLMSFQDELIAADERGERFIEREFRMLTRDGATRWIQGNYTLVRDDGGRPGKVVGSLRDVTGRRLVENALHIKDSALASSVNAIALAGLDGALTYVNPAFVSMWGYSDEQQVLGRSAVDFWQQPDAAGSVVQAMGETGGWIGELIALRQDGSNFPAQVTASLVMDHANQPVALFAAFEDITERKRAEETIRRRAEELSGLYLLGKNISATLSVKELASASLQGILDAIHPHLAYFFLRKGDALELAALAPEGIVQARLVPEHRVGECMCGLAVKLGRTMYSHDIYTDMRCTWEECKKAGYRSFAALPLWGDAEVIGVVGLASVEMHDYAADAEFLETLAGQLAISLQNALLYERLQERTGELEREVAVRQRAEERLKTALAEKETLLRELHHRTKNNMQVINSLLVLQAISVGDERLKAAFKDTQNRIQSMALVHQKLYEARDLSRVNLKDYINDLLNLLLVSYKVSSASLSIIPDMEDVYLLIDAAIPCGLILNELISNTLKYAFPNQQPGEIKVTLRRAADGEIFLSLADNGVGFPPGFDVRHSGRLGIKNIIALAEGQLRGQVRFESGPGLTCHLRFRDDAYTSRV